VKLVKIQIFLKCQTTSAGIDSYRCFELAYLRKAGNCLSPDRALQLRRPVSSLLRPLNVDDSNSFVIEACLIYYRFQITVVLSMVRILFLRRFSGI